MAVIIGLDLSLTSTGIAVVQDAELECTQAVPTKALKGVAGTCARIRKIGSFVFDYLSMEPDLVVIEGPSLASKFGSPHERAGLWWYIADMANEMGCPIAVVSPTARAKYATGKGNAQKLDVHAAVKEQYATPDIPIKTNDEADAVILAAMGSRHLRERVEECLSDERLVAMDKVMWP